MKGDFTRRTFSPEKHYHGVLKQQGRVDVDADWNEQRAITTRRVEMEARDVIGPCGAPAGNAGFGLTPSPNGNTLMIGAGRAYVDGILIENEAAVAIDSQPDVPGFQLPNQPGVYLAYLEVWLRHITALDDGYIREVALGGADTCTRAKTVWQVKLLTAGTVAGLNCSSPLRTWDAVTAPSTGRLAARAEPDPTAEDPCTIPVKAGYRRLENQLYRVEIHDAGLPGTATFKWSRDNGSVVTKVTGFPSPNGDQVAVSSTGRDSVLGFAPGQWVELNDDTHELAFQPGTLVRIVKVEDGVLTVDIATATGSLAPADFSGNPKVRRWDSVAASPALASVATGAWLNLESGVQVNFTAGRYVTGDYWLIPARTLTADVEWPVAGGNPVAEPPLGIRRHFCRLAVVALQANGWSLQTVCLPVFPPLTGVAPSPAVHVIAVNRLLPSGAQFSIDNDDHIPISQMGNIIEAVTDSPLAPACAHIAACFLTVDTPHVQTLPGAGSGVPVSFQPMILFAPVTLATGGAGLRCTLLPEILVYLNSLFSPQATQLLVHLNLKSAKIFSRDDPSAYLDGEAFGVTKTTGLGMRLPSGNGESAGDFEMWFWLMQHG